MVPDKNAHTEELQPHHRQEIEALFRSVGVFYEYEIDLALQQFDKHFSSKSQDEMVIRGCFSNARELVGYVNVSVEPASDGYWRLNWLVIDPQNQGRGFGSSLLKFAERQVDERRGRALLVETGGKDSFRVTRHFYETRDYIQVGRIPRFFSKDDDKVIYVKACNDVFS